EQAGRIEAITVSSTACPYYHKFAVQGTPFSGGVNWLYTLYVEGDLNYPDEQQLVIPYNCSRDQLTYLLQSTWEWLTEDDFLVRGGPLPIKPLSIRWTNETLADALALTWDDNPTEYANSMTNDAYMVVDEINP